MAHSLFNRVIHNIHTNHRRGLIHTIRGPLRHNLLGFDGVGLVVCHNGKANLNDGWLTVLA